MKSIGFAMLVTVTVTLGACGDGGSGQGAATAAGALEVAAGFYPLEFLVSEVGGAHVSVANLTPVGAEPHDLELSPRDAAALDEADLIVYLDGFSPALDDSVDGRSNAFDVAALAGLPAAAAGSDEHADDDQDVEHADDEQDDEHAGEEQDDEHGHSGDPHFWLDPTKYADVADSVAERLAMLAPEHADEFAANAAALGADLEALDAEYMAGLADCAGAHLVTSHTAFTFLAERYGLEQVGITGLSPQEVPSPAKLAEVTEFVDEHGVTTIFYETLVDPAIAETVAAETGAATAVLDPLEGLADGAAGDDYFDVMRANLAALRTGLGCA